MPATTRITIKTATIANGATVSDVVDLGPSALLAIEMPAAFTGTTLAIHGCSTSGGTYGLINLPGFTNPVTVAASGKYSIDPLLTAGWPYIKVVSSGAEGASRAVTLLIRPV